MSSSIGTGAVVTQTDYIPSIDDISIELVDAAEARKLLGSQPLNRRVKERKVLQYRRDLEAGKWRWNGESIKIDTGGAMIDGQHRCLAIIAADACVPMLVVRNVERLAQETIDTGSARTFGDALKMRGEANNVLLGGIVVHIWIYEHNDEFRRQLSTPSIAEYMECFERHANRIRGLPARVKRVTTQTRLAPSITGFLMWLLDPIDPYDSEFFFQRLADGANLAPNHPILHLRRSLDRQDRFTKLDTRTQAALTIKAWNKFRDGEDVAQLKFTQGGASPEQFPTPH